MASGDERGSGRLTAAPASASMALSMERPMSAQTPASSLIAGLQQGQHPFMTASARPEVCDVVPVPRNIPVSCAGGLPALCWKLLCHTSCIPYVVGHLCSPGLVGADKRDLMVIRRAFRSSWTAGTCSAAAPC